MEIGKVHDERKCQSQRQSTTPGGSEQTKAGSEKAAIAQKQWSGGSRVIKIHSAIPGGGVSKKKVSRWADRLSGKKACLVVRVNHNVVSVADLCCCLV
ncbi:unknown [Prevotella sp. CAG:279]|nr:unknown [Prevotella sp. CAG:279]